MVFNKCFVSVQLGKPLYMAALSQLKSVYGVMKFASKQKSENSLQHDRHICPTIDTQPPYLGINTN